MSAGRKESISQNTTFSPTRYSDLGTTTSQPSMWATAWLTEHTVRRLISRTFTRLRESVLGVLKYSSRASGMGTWMLCGVYPKAYASSSTALKFLIPVIRWQLARHYRLSEGRLQKHAILTSLMDRISIAGRNLPQGWSCHS